MTAVLLGGNQVVGTDERADATLPSNPSPLTYLFVVANICVMELTLADTARQANRTHRFAQQAVQSGELPALRMVGRTTVVDDVAARAWMRSLARGRMWSPEVREAALDLLSTGTTDRLSSSERSRLRRRLRSMTTTEMAHAAGVPGGAWGRYRTTQPTDLQHIGPSALRAGSLGVLPGPTWITFTQAPNLDLLERSFPRVVATGSVGLVFLRRISISLSGRSPWSWTPTGTSAWSNGNTLTLAMPAC